MGKKITIEIGIEEKSYRYQAPASWNDLTRDQLLAWANVLDMYLTRDEALNLMLMVLYNIPKSIFIQLSSPFLYQLRETISFLEENRLTKNVIGTIRLFGRRLYGPDNRLANITIGEYSRTETYYQLYLANRERRFALLLAATLFRPKGEGNSRDDVRMAITEEGISKRADFFSWAMPNNLLRAILLFYEGCRSNIVRMHPEVFPAPSVEMDKGPLAQAKTNKLMDLDEHILAYAGGKLGNYEETRSSNVYVFLKHMAQRIEEMNRSKK